MRIITLIFIILLISLFSCSENPIKSPISAQPAYPSIDAYPNWSPDGKHIIYYHYGIMQINNGGSSHIDPDSAGLWMVNSDGTNPHLILRGSSINSDWSLDSEGIVFVKDAQIYKCIVVGNSVDNSSIVQLTFEGRNFLPSWSPDGEWIVYDSDYDSPNGMNFIWKMKSDGSQKRPIAFEPTVGEIRMPDWSSNSNLIVHIRYIGNGTPEIFTMDTSGSNPIQLTNNHNFNNFPKYSPGGLKIVFETNSESQQVIWITNNDGTNPQKVIYGRQPSWSPDGKKIVFSNTYAGTINDAGTLWTIDIDGTNLKQITFGPR